VLCPHLQKRLPVTRNRNPLQTLWSSGSGLEFTCSSYEEIPNSLKGVEPDQYIWLEVSRLQSEHPATRDIERTPLIIFVGNNFSIVDSGSLTLQ
jgi:hypothetical protein